MTFDFTSIMQRSGKDSIAVDMHTAPGSIPPGDTKPEFSRIPMWVADMNFPVPACIVDAIIARASHPSYGYFIASDEMYDAIEYWHREVKGVPDVTREVVQYQNGVLGGVISALNTLCSAGDKVLLHAPTYIGFTNCITNNGYKIVHSTLHVGEDGQYHMDLEEMERLIVEHRIHVTVFCSPHNPTGRVWKRGELEAMMAIFERHDVTIISDEIWSDLILDDHTHIPTQSVNEYARNNTIALYAPSKTFSLAGLVGAYSVVYDQRLNDRLAKEGSLSHYNSMNVLSNHALVGGYSETGKAWKTELVHTIQGNRDYVCHFLAEHLPAVRFATPQATYMLYLDCTDWLEANGQDIDTLQSRGVEYGVIWQDGRPFNQDNTIRLNLASPLSVIQEACARMRDHIFVA